MASWQKKNLLKVHSSRSLLYIVCHGLIGYAKVFGNSEASKAEALRIFEEVDINGSGEIDYSGNYFLIHGLFLWVNWIEFVIASMNKDKLLSTQKMAQAFSMFDQVTIDFASCGWSSLRQNGDGYITRDELEAVMGGVNLPAEDWIQIIEEVDTNKDGKVWLNSITLYIILNTIDL